MGLIHMNTLNSSPDKNGFIWTASFEKNGRKGCSSKVHKAKKFHRYALKHERAIVRTFLEPQVPTKLLCDLDLQNKKKQCDWAVMKVEFANQIIQAFNERFFKTYCVKIRIHSVLEVLIDSKHDEWCLIEDRCQEPFIYFVDRYGEPTTDARIEILQTLVHFSYHYTSGKLIMTNLKGCKDSKSFSLSIPTIHSVSGKFGLKDKGLEGIEKCLERHICNHDCAVFMKHEPLTESKSRPRTPSAPYDPKDLGLDVGEFRQSEYEKDTLPSRVLTQGSPVDLTLDLKDTEDLMPPPYSPIDPNPLYGESPNHSPKYDQVMVSSFKYMLPLCATELNQCTNYVEVCTRSDDVFR